MKNFKLALAFSLIITVTGCGVDSNPVSPDNTAPISRSGVDQSIVSGAVVTLDGSASTDADEDPLTYLWELVSIPDTSSAILNNANAPGPTFTADIPGSYIASLIVNDGIINSTASTVTVIASFANAASDTNSPPASNAGADQNVAIGDTVALDGSASSDADGDPLIYSWAFIYKPAGSNAEFSSISVANPTFVPDLDGDYVCSLVVNDGNVNSGADTVIIVVTRNSRNIILLIGDGMGFEEVLAASLYVNGDAGSLHFENFPFQGSVTTSNSSGGGTDSAAASTAMATGFKVDNGVISQQIPGDGLDLETILETAKLLGASTGLVTTTTISHATPAAFGAHESNRANYSEIIYDYLTGSRPNVLFGGAQFIDPATAVSAGYTVVESYDELISLNTDLENRVWGQFGETQMPYEFDSLGILPHLSESTLTALNILDNDPDGFFLMVEGGRIDHAGHSNDIQRNIFETIEFSHTVQIVSNWVTGRDDTLIIVTADHETGGLQVVSNNGQGNFPDVTWSTTGHTGQVVPIFTWGLNASLLSGNIDNTDIISVMKATLTGQ